MRTDYTGGAGPGTQSSDRPIWEAQDTSELDSVTTAPPAGDSIDSDGLRVTSAYISPPRSGRHKAAHKAPRRRDAARKPAPAPPTDAVDPDEPSAEGRHGAGRGSRSRGDLVRMGVRGIGQTLITFGLIVLLFVVYELFITDVLNGQAQQNLTEELEQKWADDPTLGPDLPNGGLSNIPLGDGIAFIRIPAFGVDYVRVVVEGTNAAELSEGPGHYVDTAMPGELGNFALAGHRVSQGAPFLDLDKLLPGDAIVIETADTYFTYRVLGDPETGDFGTDPSGVSGQVVVSPEEVDVINPIPGISDGSVVPTTAYLTLTTCTPKFSAAQRLIIHAELEGPGLPKADYPNGPPAMTEG